MKCMYYIGLLLCLFKTVGAQEITKEVISSTGDYFVKVDYGSLECTMGEISTSFMKQSQGFIFEGFHHPHKNISTKVNNLDLKGIGIFTKTFPNPVINKLFISVDKVDAYSIDLLDVQNRIIKSKEFSQFTYLDMEGLPAAVYYIRIRKEYLQSELHKIIKL